MCGTLDVRGERHKGEDWALNRQAHKKCRSRGRARDRRAIREFQFHEYADLRAGVTTENCAIAASAVSVAVAADQLSPPGHSGFAPENSTTLPHFSVHPQRHLMFSAQTC